MEHESKRNPVWRRIAFTALIACLLGLVLTGAETVPLPESVSSCLPCHDGGAGGQIGEWLASPYSETAGGRGCSDCHAGRCSGNGEAGEPAENGTGVDLSSLRKALLLWVTASCAGEAVEAEVAVSNVGAGHLLPSPAGGRKLILEVNARAGEQELQPWPAGSSHPQLPPFATEVSRYRFVSKLSSHVHVSARLLLAPASGPALEVANTSTVCISSGELP